MKSIEEIIIYFNRIGSVVTRIIDYKQDSYVVFTLDKDYDPNNKFVGRSMFRVYKNEKLIEPFLPNMDLKGYFDAVDNRTIYEKKGGLR